MTWRMKRDEKEIAWRYKERWREVRLNWIKWRRENLERAYPHRYFNTD